MRSFEHTVADLDTVLDLLRRAFATARRLRTDHTAATLAEAEAIRVELVSLSSDRAALWNDSVLGRTNSSGMVRWSRFGYAGPGHGSFGTQRRDLLDALGPTARDPDRWYGQFGVALSALAHTAATGGASALEAAARDESFPQNKWWRATRTDPSGDPDVRVFTVIHVLDAAHAARQSRLAVDCGADGVFLINHEIDVDALLDCYGAVRQELGPEAFVGVNPLGGHPVTVTKEAAARFDHLFDGIWVDDAGVDEARPTQPDTYRVLSDLAPRLVCFGGVPLRHAPRLGNLTAAARAAAGHLDVLTAPGNAAGGPSAASDVTELVEAAPGLPVAVAGGITPLNVRDVAGRAHAVLAATGISRDFHHLDPSLVRALVDAAAEI